jgi:phosphate transport system permease protein
LPKESENTISWGRRIKNSLALTSIIVATAIVIVPLFLIMGTVAYHGIAGLNLAFFTDMPKPPGESGGGMANALVGSGLILMVASAIGIPLGIGTGIFLSEYGRNFYGNVIRFTADVLNGVPSIVIGLTAWALVVVSQKHFSALSGGIALGIMMIPTVSRTTEEVLLLVPQAVREAALGLGIPRWRTTL